MTVKKVLSYQNLGDSHPVPAQALLTYENWKGRGTKVLNPLYKNFGKGKIVCWKCNMYNNHCL